MSSLVFNRPINASDPDPTVEEHGLFFALPLCEVSNFTEWIGAQLSPAKRKVDAFVLTQTVAGVTM